MLLTCGEAANHVARDGLVAVPHLGGSKGGVRPAEAACARIDILERCSSDGVDGRLFDLAEDDQAAEEERELDAPVNVLAKKFQPGRPVR
jgi:hypothetical protein